MAGENRPVQAAMGFAMLFPEKTLSLIACSPPRVDMYVKSHNLAMLASFIPEGMHLNGFGGRGVVWRTPGVSATIWTLSTPFLASSCTSALLQWASPLGTSPLVSDRPHQTLDEDEADEIVDYWYRFYPPAHITRTIALRIIINNVNFATLLHLFRLTSFTLWQHKRISCLECSWFTQPVMIIQVLWNSQAISTLIWSQFQGSNKYQPSLFPVLEQNFIESLSHVPGGVQVVTIEDASYCLAIPRKTAPKVNSAVANFIKNLDRTQRPSFSLPTDRAERFRLALEKIAQLEPNSDIGSRNPLSAFSYSRVTPTKAKANYEASVLVFVLIRTQLMDPCRIILPQMEIEKHGFDPVTPDGAIIRPYSERSSYDHRPRAPSVVSLTEEISVTEE